MAAAAEKNPTPYTVTMRELSGVHLGKRVTINANEAQITGILAGVTHTAEKVHNVGLLEIDGGEVVALGRPRTEVELLGWSPRAFPRSMKLTVHP